MKPFLTLKELKEKLAQKEVSSNEVISFYINRLKKYNEQLNAALEIYDLTQEDLETTSDSLAGLPGIIKDNFCQKGRITSCGSKMLANYRAPYDATVIKRLKKHGAVIIGRGNMDEFAMGSSGEFSAYGPTLNPWDLKHSPGGSSSGSAAAVAAGLVPWAIGSDTGGSVRQPAAFCSLVGLYPTYGLFSRYGLVAFVSSNDQPGPLTKTVYDNALIASALSGHDPKDSTSISKPPIDFTKVLTGKLPGDLTIGIIKDSLKSKSVDSQIKSAFEGAINQLEKLGAKIKHIELPNLKYGISDYFVISRTEAASNLSRFDGTLYGMRSEEAKELQEMYIKTRHDNLGPEVKRRILMGNYVLSVGHRDAFYTKALQVRAMIKSEFEQAFKEVDVLTSPTTATLAFEIGKECKDPLALYLNDYFTVPTNMAGIPAISVPCGFSAEGLPIGFQLIGPRLSEKLLYQIAYSYEQNTPYHLKTPKGFE